MINQEILSGLRLALERGHSIKDAMMSFYNAGYNREEIEEAAKALQMQQPSLLTPQPKPSPTKPSPALTFVKKPEKREKPEKVKPPFQVQQPIQPIKQPVQQLQPQPQVQVAPTTQFPQQIPQVIQVVSKYDEKTNRNALIVILVIALISLFGVLSALLIFKNEIVTLLSKLF